MRKKLAPPSDDCVVPVYGEPLPCGAEYDRQTAPQVTPSLRTPATVAKAKNKQRSSKRVPAVLDLINQLMLCAPMQPPDQPPPITVKPAFVVAQGLLVPRLCNVPPAYTIPGC